jgi:hypothetical protein
VATADVAVNAEAVYRAVVKEAGARSSTIKIVRRDNPGRLVEITDGVQTASIKVVPLTSEKTGLVVVADVPRSAGGEKASRSPPYG